MLWQEQLVGELNNKILLLLENLDGHELDSKKGLLEWFLNQEESVEGFKETIFSDLLY